MNQCLSLCGVWKSFDAGVRGCSASVSVLRDVHLDVDAGTMVGIAAAPTSGKTTLLMCAAGLMRPDRGLVSWFGAPARRDHSARPDGIALAGDRPFPYGFLTIREAVEYAAIVRDLPLRDSASRVSTALERVGLGAIAHRRVDSVHGGGAARLAIATALLAHPRLVFVDDFAPGCDLDTATELLVVLRSLASEGAAIVVAGRFSHVLANVANGTTPMPRFYSLTSGRLLPVHADDGGALRPHVMLPAPHAHTRVAESARHSAAQDDGAH